MFINDQCGGYDITLLIIIPIFGLKGICVIIIEEKQYICTKRFEQIGLCSWHNGLSFFIPYT